MKRTIVIIAPLIDQRQLHAGFNLKLRQNNRELTLAALYEFGRKDFQVSEVSRGIDHTENIPSAGYYLEGLLRQHGYDTILTNKYDPETLNKLASHNPFAVCVSTTMVITTDSLIELFSSIRLSMPDTKIIGGGVFIWKNYLLYQQSIASPLISPLPSWMLFNPVHAGMDADILIVAPHGKSSLLEALFELEKGSKASFEHIPNLALPDGKNFTFTKRNEEQVDYNQDFTRWDLVQEIPVKIPLRTSIGCPYRCRFCDFYHLYPTVFLRSGKSLSDELKLIQDRSVRTPAIIHVSDDNVFINKKRLQDVCTVIAESKIRNWIGFMRSGDYSADEMELIQRSRLMMGIIGVESGDQGQLGRMNKRQKAEKVKKGIEQLDASGISTLMTLIVGFPGETMETIMNTADFLNSLTLDNILSSYQLYPLTIQPLSELNDPAVRSRWKIEGSMDTWSHYTMNSDDAREASYTLFREVTNVPYHYFEESNFFNRGKFKLPTRKELFQLRHQLTIKLIEKAPWELIEPILKSLLQNMGLSSSRTGENLRDEISFTNKQPEQ